MRCEPANTIIKKFKGLKPLAEVTGVTVHSVMRWRKPREQGGTGGVVPHWHIDEILRAAQERGIDIREIDFLPVSRAAK
ncbi:hypothetical protein [Ensifer adhaerens]|jgi:hypothetical protein|uniref:hypothetical protein n=1 Tax=Ensifer adhaerens TaxID=106592 RepID=UPI00202EE508|nr:hypothetical protein [Ensifer adhaerens]